MGEEGLSEGETEIVSAVDTEGQGYSPRCVWFSFVFYLFV